MEIEKTAGNTPLKKVPDRYCPPDERQWFVIEQGPDKGKKLFFYDYQCGQGEPEATFLFVHGNPESSYTYRGIIEEIERKAVKPVRIVAMDHIGFGLSDQASFEMVDMHHAANVAQLVKGLDLRDITLVIHDWGGPIGVGSFIGMSERVTSLALMNTTVFPMPESGLVYTRFPMPYLMPWTYVGHVVPDIFWRWIPPMVMFSPGNQRDFFLKHIPSYLARLVTGRLSQDEKIYRDMFSTKANARSSKRNVKQTGQWGHGYTYTDPKHGVQDNHDFYRKIQTEVIPEWAERNIKACAFFGLYDPCGKAEVQQQWSEALPQLADNILRFEGVGHFVEENRPTEIADGILKMLSLNGDDN